MHHNPKDIAPEGVGVSFVGIGAGALRLILSGFSARAHAIAGTRPSSQNLQSLPRFSPEGIEGL